MANRRLGLLTGAALFALTAISCGEDTPIAPAAAGDAAGAKDGSVTTTDGSSVNRDASTSDAGVAIDGAGDASADGFGANSSDVAIEPEPGPSVFRVLPARLDFGTVDCGAQAQPQTFLVTNTSTENVNWTAALDKGGASAYLLAPATGTLASGASVTVTVSPKAVPATATVEANGFGDTITLSSNVAGDSPRHIPLLETARGAILAFSPKTVDFPNVPLASGASSSKVGLVNSGNAAATVTLTPSGSPAFSIDPTTAQAVDPQTIKSFTVNFRPTDMSAASGSVAMTIAPGQPLCAPLPAPLALSGTGTNGSVAVKPVRIAFGEAGLVDCGSTAAPSAVTVSNTGTALFTFVASLGKGPASPYTLTPATGSVSPGSTVTITVTPRALPATANLAANFYGDTLTVSTNVTGDSPHIVALEQSARGLVLARSTAAINFAGVPVGTSVTGTFSLTNMGNIGATINTSNANPAFEVAGPIVLGVGPSSVNVNVKFSPAAVGPLTDLSTIIVPANTPVCAPLPVPMALAGVGAATNVVASPILLAFGGTACGKQASPQTFMLKNNGPATTFTTSLDKGLQYKVTPATGMLAAGASLAVTVTPSPIPQFAPTTANGFADVIHISSGNGNATVSLTQSAVGAVLSFRDPLGAALASLPFGSVATNGSANKNIRVRNDGNASASVTFKINNDDPNYSVSPTTAVVAPGSLTNDHTVTFTPRSTGAKPQTLSLTAEGICAPLPPGLTLTGTGS